MAECYYILKTPSGESIKIPANLSTIEESEEISSLFNSFLTETVEEEKNKLRSVLSDSIARLTKNKIKNQAILQSIDSSNTISEFYESINNTIENFGTLDNIGEAVRQYVYERHKGKKESRKDVLSSLKKTLNKKLSKEYFTDINFKGLIGASSLYDEKIRIKDLKEENNRFGWINDTVDNLSVFLSWINTKNDTKKSKILFGAVNVPTGKAWVADDFVLYDKTDDLNLFLALFKKQSLKLSPIDLKERIEILNKALKLRKNKEVDLTTFNIEKFFLGEVTDVGIMPSDFEILMSKAKDKEVVDAINGIVDLVSESINPTNRSLKKATRELFWQLYPESYGKQPLEEILAERKKLQLHLDAEKDYKAKTADWSLMEEPQRNLNYTIKQTLSGENLFLQAKQTLSVYEDLVLFKNVGKNGIYATPRGLYDRGDGKVAIYGVIRLPDGSLSYVNDTFKDSIEYRKKTSMIDPYNPYEEVIPREGVYIAKEDKGVLDYSLLSKILRKGDEIGGKIIVGIYPTSLKVQNPKTGEVTDQWYTKIKSIVSSKALEEIESEPNINISSLVTIKNPNDLVEGDYFTFTSEKGSFYKRVLFTDKDMVYSWIPAKDGGYIIKGISKEGLTGYKSSFSAVSKSEIEMIRGQAEITGKTSANMSSFQDSDNAQSGDFVYYEEGDLKYYGKVVDNQKVYLTSLKSDAPLIVKSLSDLADKNPVFLTNRNISDSYAVYTVEANEWIIKFKPESDSELDVEAVYVIPSDFNLNNLVFVAGNKLSAGAFQAKSAAIKEGLIDITDKAMQILGQTGKPFIQKISSDNNGYKRNIDSMLRIPETFRDLPIEKKEELGIVSSGTYVKLWLDGKSTSDIYRISEVNKKSVKLQLNKLSHSGKLLTKELTLTKDQLLAESTGKLHPEYSISEVFLIKGNNKFQGILEDPDLVKNKVEKKVDLKRIDLLTETIDNFKKFLGKELGDQIDVEIVPKSNFKNGQKAKIETEVLKSNVDGVVKNQVKTSIKINKETGTTDDVVHEFLHLFLTPLRYKYPELYFKLISTVPETTGLNVTDAEEKFVEEIVRKLANNSDPIDFLNVANFVEGLAKALDIITPDERFEEYNPIELLQMPLARLFGLNTKKIKTHEMFNLGMINTEPMMRQWMSKNDIIFKCN